MNLVVFNRGDIMMNLGCKLWMVLFGVMFGMIVLMSIVQVVELFLKVGLFEDVFGDFVFMGMLKLYGL